eukprot:6460785-Amphidinium_carterae.1
MGGSKAPLQVLAKQVFSSWQSREQKVKTGMKTPGQVADLTGISSQMYSTVALWQDALRAKIEQNQAAFSDTWPEGQEAL